ncbi:MAG: hypothetical protein AVDCRST_MAG36-2077, partial [uncultured Nocardioidaceae bacterium]
EDRARGHRRAAAGEAAAPRQRLRERLQQQQRQRTRRHHRAADRGRGVAGRRFRQLVRHDPGDDHLLPRPARGGGEAAVEGPRRPPADAGRGPDVARPADADPHRRLRL